MGHSSTDLCSKVMDAFYEFLEEAGVSDEVDFESEIKFAENIISAFEEEDYDCIHELNGEISDAFDCALYELKEEED